MTSQSLAVVYARTRAGQNQVLLMDRATTLAEHLLMRLNGYSPLERLLTAAERPHAAAALGELLMQGWIEPVRDEHAVPAESQWGSMDGLAA
jgi:hypothetical protein